LKQEMKENGQEVDLSQINMGKKKAPKRVAAITDPTVCLFSNTAYQSLEE